jgi:hypothetical protein
MKNLSEKSSTQKVTRRLGVLSARLHGQRETQPFAASMVAERTHLRDVAEAHEQTVISRMAATATAEACDDTVDTSLQKLSRDYLALVDGNREDPTYVQGFPIAPSISSANTGDATQHHYVRVAIATFLNFGERDADGNFLENPRHQAIRDQAARLAADQVNLEAAQAAQATAYQAEALAEAALKLAHNRACTAYNRLYIHLIDRLPHLKPFIESVFA